MRSTGKQLDWRKEGRLMATQAILGLYTVIIFCVPFWHSQERDKNSCYSFVTCFRWYNMCHNSGDSIGGSTGPPAGSGGISKRHRGCPRNPAKNPAGQLRSNSAETQMHSNKPRLVSCLYCCIGTCGGWRTPPPSPNIFKYPLHRLGYLL